MHFDRDRKVKYICTFHGAGDSKVGFDRRFSEYDLLLVSGEELVHRLKSTGLLHDRNKANVIGYMKLELPYESHFKLPFKNINPVVLYNPHHEKSLSSWWLDGEGVLQWFKDNPNYNLIFAPHIKVFNGIFPGVLEKYKGFENIFIDVNSDHLFDATYTRMADVYLGDLSSQVYEFLYFKESPCIFINSHKVEGWQSNLEYQMWQLGEVVNDLSELPVAVSNCFAVHSSFNDRQANIKKLKFSIDPGTSASLRGALAISDFLKVKS